jgi:hypothetical protein
MRKALFLLCSAPLAMVTSAARADDPPDMSARVEDPTRHEIDRTWLYADDARVAAPMTVTATSSLSYTSVGTSPSRVVTAFPGCPSPCSTYSTLGGNTAVPGGMLQVGGELGLLPRLSVMAVGQVGMGGSDGVPSPNVGALAGLRFQVFPSEWRTLHMAVSGGYLREAWQGPAYNDDTGSWTPGNPNGDNGAWVQASFSGDFHRLRLATTVHGEHVFSAGRDPVDIMVQAGASYRVAGPLRAGVEYVGQDLEESFSNAAEHGARHLLGPIASVQLLDSRFTLVAGPSVGLTPRSPDVLGRIAAAYSF